MRTLVLASIPALALACGGRSPLDQGLSGFVGAGGLRATGGARATGGSIGPGGNRATGGAKSAVTGGAFSGGSIGSGGAQFTGGVSGIKLVARSVAPASTHTCAVVSDGTVQCWGYNNYGQLGNGTTTDSLVPLSASNISTAVTVATNNSHSCALLRDGTIKCWGLNSSGQLGNGTVTNSSLPVPVSNVSIAVAVSVGFSHTCALLRSSNVFCWGSNFQGTLGNGTTINSSVPVQVTNISSAVSVTSCGSKASGTCVVLADGSIECWGYNVLGLFGNGTTTSSTVPVPVSNISSALVATAGVDGHACAVLADGSIQCWGGTCRFGCGRQ